MGSRALIAIMLLLVPVAAGAHPKMLFIGDSISVGVGADDPATQGFVALFAERFPELVVANAGCSGSSTRDWTIDRPSRFCAFSGAWHRLAEPELPAQITHVMLGTNDAFGFLEFFPGGAMGRWLAPEEYERRLRLLIERAPGLVFVSTTPPLENTQPSPASDRLRSYRDVVLSVVEDHRRVRLGVDFLELLDPTTDMIGVHPNTRGHAIMADALERRVLSLRPIRALARHRHSKRFGRPGLRRWHPHGNLAEAR